LTACDHFQLVYSFFSFFFLFLTCEQTFLKRRDERGWQRQTWDRERVLYFAHHAVGLCFLMVSFIQGMGFLPLTQIAWSDLPPSSSPVVMGIANNSFDIRCPCCHRLYYESTAFRVTRWCKTLASLWSRSHVLSTRGLTMVTIVPSRATLRPNAGLTLERYCIGPICL
jgi:hypothetical protein